VALTDQLHARPRGGTLFAQLSGMSASGSHVVLAAALAVLTTMLTGCARPVAVHPVALDDARLGARVKTALVNDALVGARLIEVRVARGVVTLTGHVASDPERDRVLDLARGVPGVVDVRPLLVVTPPASPAPATQGTAPVRPPGSW